MNSLTAYLILATLLGLGIAAILLPRFRPGAFSQRLRSVGGILLALGLFGLFTRLGEIIWDGGYSRAEFQITLQDPNGRPVEGLQLQVEDQRGHTFYHYPVTDFLPDRVPTSDSNGLMVFHHASGGIEFSGRCWPLFGFLPVEEHPGPVYLCRFLYRGQEVSQLRYSEIDRWRSGTWDEVEKVKHRRKWPDWPMSELLLPNGDPCEDWDDRAMRLFDLDGDGKFDPEERAAYYAGTNPREQEAAIARRKGEDPTEEREFPVVRRTVTIRLRPE